MRGGHDSYVRAWVLEQHGQCVASGITVGPELVERGAVLLGVLVPGLGISPPDGVGLRGYVLSDDQIVVKRLGWQTVLPLQGMQSVSGDATAMQGSLRIFGNGGLLSFTGEFWNRKLGRYRALATDPDRAVVLRYARRVIVITPHDPQQFIMRARSLLKFAASPFAR